MKKTYFANLALISIIMVLASCNSELTDSLSGGKQSEESLNLTKKEFQGGECEILDKVVMKQEGKGLSKDQIAKIELAKLEEVGNLTKEEIEKAAIAKQEFVKLEQEALTPEELEKAAAAKQEYVQMESEFAAKGNQEKTDSAKQGFEKLEEVKYTKEELEKASIAKQESVEATEALSKEELEKELLAKQDFVAHEKTEYSKEELEKAVIAKLEAVKLESDKVADDHQAKDKDTIKLDYNESCLLYKKKMADIVQDEATLKEAIAKK